MKTRIIPTLILLSVLLAACAPAATQPTAAPPEVVVDLPSTTPLNDLPAPTSEAFATQVSAPTALPIATSRGPDLEATDPTTVSLASGQYQFVEFFRFT